MFSSSAALLSSSSAAHIHSVALLPSSVCAPLFLTYSHFFSFYCPLHISSRTPPPNCPSYSSFLSSLLLPSLPPGRGCKPNPGSFCSQLNGLDVHKGVGAYSRRGHDTSGRLNISPLNRCSLHPLQRLCWAVYLRE